MTIITIDVPDTTVNWYQAEARERKTTWQALVREVLEWFPEALTPEPEPPTRIIGVHVLSTGDLFYDEELAGTDFPSGSVF